MARYLTIVAGNSTQSCKLKPFLFSKLSQKEAHRVFENPSDELALIKEFQAKGLRAQIAK